MKNYFLYVRCVVHHRQPASITVACQINTPRLQFDIRSILHLFSSTPETLQLPHLHHVTVTPSFLLRQTNQLHWLTTAQRFRPELLSTEEIVPMPRVQRACTGYVHEHPLHCKYEQVVVVLSLMKPRSRPISCGGSRNQRNTCDYTCTSSSGRSTNCTQESKMRHVPAHVTRSKIWIRLCEQIN